MLRTADLMERGIPYAVVDDEFNPDGVVLQPGEKGVLPVKWLAPPEVSITDCCLHPDAPPGLDVQPGTNLPDKRRMALAVHNDSGLPLTLSSMDTIALGIEEGALPDFEDYQDLQDQYNCKPCKKGY